MRLSYFITTVKFMFSKEATKIDKNLHCQIDGEDFVNVCCLLRKHKLYLGENDVLNTYLVLFHKLPIFLKLQLCATSNVQLVHSTNRDTV